MKKIHIFRTIQKNHNYILCVAILILLIINKFIPSIWPLLWFGSAIGSLPTLAGAFASLRKKKISIDTFNTFALVTEWG